MSPMPSYLFNEGDPLPAPFPGCGEDPSGHPGGGGDLGHCVFAPCLQRESGHR